MIWIWLCFMRSSHVISVMFTPFLFKIWYIHPAFFYLFWKAWNTKQNFASLYLPKQKLDVVDVWKQSIGDFSLFVWRCLPWTILNILKGNWLFYVINRDIRTTFVDIALASLLLTLNRTLLTCISFYKASLCVFESLT